MIGQTIKHYHITAKIGEGGMGEVYQAEDTNLKRQVALKFLPRHFSSDEEARSRFKREAQALAALNHQNIVAVHDVSEHDGQPFIAMEYVEGQSLKELIESGDVDVNRAVELASQGADGLAAAHKRDIVHRDIKSENIVISSEVRVKIMDFGLATWSGVTKVTAEGSTLGTRAYMSPEQSIGQDVDHRSDLWSLGVVLYELVTGRLPFEGGHDSAIAYSIANEEPEPIARYKSGSPDELQRIVSKCLAKNPDERYQSAADLATDLRSAKSGTPTSAAVSTSPPSRFKKTLVSVGAVVAVAVIAVVAAFVWNPFQPATEDAEAKRKMLAVLPFENLGSDDQEYFADGMTEEIISRLATIGKIGVISRTSIMTYKNSEKTLPVIAAELGVDYILEGTIRWDRTGDTDYVRITPQLINVGDDTHLWADRIERPLEGIFAIQADIAEQVASALDVALLQPDRHAITREQSVDLEAYDYYLRGQEIVNQDLRALDGPEHLERGIAMFDRALAIDSGFAKSHAAKSKALSLLHFVRGQFLGERPHDSIRIQAGLAAQAALRIDASLIEAHLAMGFYNFWVIRDPDAALRHFEVARERQPNSSDALFAIGLVLGRLGKIAEAYDVLRRAADLDPRSIDKQTELVGCCLAMRRFHETIQIADKAVSLFPSSSFLQFWRYIAKLGLTDEFGPRQALLDSAISHLSESGMREPILAEELRIKAARESRDYDLLIKLTLRSTFPPVTSPVDSIARFTNLGDLYTLAGQTDHGHAYYDSARTRLAEFADSGLIDDWGLASAYASLGQTLDALSMADRVFEQKQNAFYNLHQKALVYIKAGEYDQAITMLDEVLSIFEDVTVSDLKFDYRYDPLRDNPRFQALIERGDIVF